MRFVTSTTDCAELQFCAREPGVCSGQGTCAVRPEICIQVHDPVCGCDDTTYSNACYAASAGVNVFSSEPCAVADEVCNLDSDCPELQFCAREPGICSGQGTCAVKPEICIEIHDPVCGCDATTYSNSCYAASAGENIFSSEPCATIAKRVPGISSWQGVVILVGALTSLGMFYFRSAR